VSKIDSDGVSESEEVYSEVGNLNRNLRPLGNQNLIDLAASSPEKDFLKLSSLDRKCRRKVFRTMKFSLISLVSELSYDID
jgi:hypothetical protein